MTRSMKIRLIFVLVCACLTILTSATPFLKTLLTTSTAPTHISDFRNLPRSNSRANKPDVFPGFDFLEEPTTVRPRTPLDFYTRVIGGIVSQGRQTYERIVNNIQQYEINRRANLKRNSDQKLEYIPDETEMKIVIATSTESSGLESTALIDEKLKSSSKEQNWPKKYFSSILTSVGFDKLRNASDPEYLSKIIGASVTYINPLLDVWKRATTKLNFERDNTTKPQQHQYNKSADDDTSTNYPPSPQTTPLQQLNESIKTNLVSNPSSSSPSSPLGFRYAFSKYLNLFSKGYGNDDENKTISVYTELSGGGDGGVPWGNVNLNNNNTMGDVDDVDFPIERIDERNDNEDDIQDDDDIALDDEDDETNEQGNFDAGNFGIFILEIFGTIAGLTWGAFAQLQSLFAQNGK